MGLGGLETTKVHLTEEDYNKFINATSHRKKTILLKSLYKYTYDSSYIQLSGGLPHSSVFPFSEFSFKLKTGETVKVEGDELNEFLQYGYSCGHHLLLKQIDRIVQKCFSPKGPNTRTILTTGNTEGTDNVMRTILEEGDTLFVEEIVYPSILSTGENYQLNIVSIPMDEEGILPNELEKACEKAIETKNPIKMLFTVPSGHNPTGRTTGLERKSEIYKIARKYNFLIVEDDPYYFLQYPSPNAEKEITLEEMPGLISDQSYLNIDYDGRVIRLDTFSKIVAPGLRCAWLTGPSVIVEKILEYRDTSTQHPSGLSEVAIYKTLALMDDAQLENFIKRVQFMFNTRRNTLLRAIKKYKIEDYAHVEIPKAGMFIWITVNNGLDSDKLFFDLLHNYHVLFVPGRFFLQNSTEKSSSLRCCFATATDEAMDTGISRLAECLKKTFSETN